MRGTPGLVTCGDADAARDVLSREFVAKSRKMNLPVIWKSYPNRPHDIPQGSLALARAFLEHYDAKHRDDLGGGNGGTFDIDKTRFVGDDPDGVYWPVGSPEAQSIPDEDRVPLPSRLLADAWGKAGIVSSGAAEGAASNPEQPGRWTFHVDGVEFVCRRPLGYSAKSRIAVLFGGRNWPGDKTLRAFGFDGMADTNRLFLVAPSFSVGEYWRPETGTGQTLRRAIDSIRRQLALEKRSVLMYGYSAGGQCAALFSAFMKGEVAAWGAHGCGVYPDADLAPQPPSLITCGEEDAERFSICRQFAYRRRESGGLVLLRIFDCGHELDPAALALARAWLSAFAGESLPIRAWGEDDTCRVLPVSRIDREFRNPLHTQEIERLWRR